MFQSILFRLIMSARGVVDRKRRISKSTRAGIVFPVARIYRYLRQACLKRRIQIGSPIYLSAVLEYLCAEVLELAGNAAKANKRRVISPRHILLAVANDDELHKLLKGVTISQGGVLPNIPQVLLYRKKQLRDAMKTSHPPVIIEKHTTKSPSKKLATNKSTFLKKSPVQQSKSIVSKKSSAKQSKSIVSKKSSAKQTKGSVVSPSTGSTFTILSEKTLIAGQTFSVVQGDISKVNCDAVVHPTNSSLSLAGQCGSALSQAGGPSFRTEVNRISSTQSLRVAEATISGSGALTCRFVIHVHSPTWNDTDALQNLEMAVKSCLDLAEKNKLVSVAFPSIASGSNNFPKQTSAQTILRCIRNYYTVSTTTKEMKQIYFVLYDMESIGIYTSELARLDQ